MSQNNNYILTENYFDNYNNQYFLISDNTLSDLYGNIYEKMIVEYYVGTDDNQQVAIYNPADHYYHMNSYRYEVKNNNLKNINSDEHFPIIDFKYGTVKFLKVTPSEDEVNQTYLIETLPSIYGFNGTYLIDDSGNEYLVTHKNNEIPSQIGILITFRENTDLFPQTDKQVHESVQYVQKNYARLDNSIEMSLISDNNNVDYLTLYQNKWIDSSNTNEIKYKNYSYYQVIDITNILKEGIQIKGNIKNYHLIISPIDIYSKQVNNQERSRTVYSKSNNQNYYYFTASKLPKTKTFATPESYYLKTNNGYVQNVDSQNYKLDYYVLNIEGQFSKLYDLNIQYPQDMNINMPNIPLTYYQNEEGQYVCLNELPDDDIRKYLNDLSGTIDIELNSGTTPVNYELIEQNPNDNNISTFNNVYSQTREAVPNTSQLIYNRTIYNSCNIRASQIDTDQNKIKIIFASDAKPTEDIRINILLLKDRELLYSITKQEG